MVNKNLIVYYINNPEAKQPLDILLTKIYGGNNNE